MATEPSAYEVPPPMIPSASPPGAPTEPSFVEEAVRALQDIVLRVSNDTSGTWMGLDVTMPQMKVLLLLRENGPLRVGILARHLNVSTPTITGIVDRLVRQELVSRQDDPTDRRVVLNALTRRGVEMMERLHNRGDVELTRAVATLTGGEQAEFTRLLRHVSDHLERGDAAH